MSETDKTTQAIEELRNYLEVLEETSYDDAYACRESFRAAVYAADKAGNKVVDALIQERVDIGRRLYGDAARPGADMVGHMRRWVRNAANASALPYHPIGQTHRLALALIDWLEQPALQRKDPELDTVIPPSVSPDHGLCRPK